MSSADSDAGKVSASPIQGTLNRKPGELYPPIEPYNTGWLTVSDLHEIFYEECGSMDGNPVVYIHGGPGGYCGPNERRYFDPKVYRIILFHQRGCGRSKPFAEIKENTTWDLVSDLEKLRDCLGVTKWVVFGGSWGSTVALAYAIMHPNSVKALIVRGIFTLRKEELMWSYKEGASILFPDKWEKFQKCIPEAERGDLLSAYYKRLTGSDRDAQLQCGKAWVEWDLSTVKLITDSTAIERQLANSDRESVAKARIQSHYFVHGGWFPKDGYLLDSVDAIRHIPATIIQGRYDAVAPMKTAWELHKRWPEADFHVVPGVGHSYEEPGIQAKLIEATDKYRYL